MAAAISSCKSGRRQRVLPAAQQQRGTADRGKIGRGCRGGEGSPAAGAGMPCAHPPRHRAEDGCKPPVAKPHRVNQQQHQRPWRRRTAEGLDRPPASVPGRLLRGPRFGLGPRRDVEQGEPRHPLGRLAHDLEGDIAAERNTGQGKSRRQARRGRGRPWRRSNRRGSDRPPAHRRGRPARRSDGARGPHRRARPAEQDSTWRREPSDGAHRGERSAAAGPLERAALAPWLCLIRADNCALELKIDKILAIPMIRRNFPRSPLQSAASVKITVRNNIGHS